MLLNYLEKEINEFYPKMVELRRDFHMHPELGFQEVRTPKVIADFLTELGLEVRTNVGGRGVVGTLYGGKPGKTIALRADFDALPIQDLKDVPYKSTVPGVMHACGHDAHTATLLGVAHVLSKYREQLQGNVVFIHQHAEELAPGGAKQMIEDGCLDGVDMIIGTHLQSNSPIGKVYYREGFIQAAADFFEIKVTGKGGHGAMPQDTIDPVVTASHIILGLQQIVSRRIDPLKSAVVTVGSLHSGETFNVIPNSALLTGTVRTFESGIRDMVEASMRDIIEGICHAFGATYQFTYTRGYDSVWNHPEETKFMKRMAEEIIGAENVEETPPIMPGEDFTYYLQKVPGTYFFTGSGNDTYASAPHHHPMFDIDEKAMLISAKIFIHATISYLNET
jgi:amidohydrolase